MSEEEIIILALATFGAIGFGCSQSPSRVPGLVLRDRAALGLWRIFFYATIVWILYVLFHFADDSVTGIYIFMYFILGVFLLRLSGESVASLLGARYKADIIERGNIAAAIVNGAFTTAAGLIYSGSIWGDANPSDASDEGGWWIPLTFYILGYLILLAIVILYIWRERNLMTRIRQSHAIAPAITFATYTLSAAWILKEAVAGDFYGWLHGLSCVGAAAALFFAHEAALWITARVTARHPILEHLEKLLYIAIAVLFYFLQGYLRTLSQTPPPALIS
jgi:hypothetical protein